LSLTEFELRAYHFVHEAFHGQVLLQVRLVHAAVRAYHGHDSAAR